MESLRRKDSEFKHQVALGRVPGWEVQRKFGMNNAVAAGTEEMWPLGVTRVVPTTAAVASASSDDAADTNTTGTGGWTLEIQGLDEDYLEVSETINLNGLGTVSTTQTFIRINRAVVLTAGTGEINAGNITINVGGNPQAYVEAGEGQTHQTHYTVPANKLFMVTNYTIGVGRMSGSTDLHILGQVRLNSGENDEAWRSITDIYLWNGGRHQNTESATVLPPKTDIRQKIVTDTSTQCYSIIGGYLVEIGPNYQFTTG